MDPQKIRELANLLRNNGDKILNSESKLTLSGFLLRALNDSFTLIADASEIGGAQSFEVVKPINSKSPVFSDLQLVYDFFQKTTLLCIIHYPTEEYFNGKIDISKFRALRRLEVQKTNVKQIIGIQPLRAQLQQLICVKSLETVEDVITHCGGDNSNGFVWNELKVADFSYNSLKTVDSSLEFAQYLQHLNLRHNQLHSVEAIKWLPHLKTLDLSFNRLQCIPQFHMEAYKRLQSLNLSNNFVEDLMGITKMDALTDLDLSDNCLLDHTCLLPLSVLVTLKYLNLYGNPLHCHPKHRLATAQFLHKNTATVKFILDFELLSKSEKAITGTQQMRHPGSLNRYTTKSSATSISSGRPTPNFQTPSSSVGSQRSFTFNDSTDNENVVRTQPVTKKRNMKVRTVEIEESIGNSPCTTTDSSKKTTIDKSDDNTEHLEAKKHIETLREKYGNEWLQSGNAEMMQSVLDQTTSGSATVAKNPDIQRNMSRQLFNDYVGEFTASTATNAGEGSTPIAITNDNVHPVALKNTSTPTDGKTQQIGVSQEPSPISSLSNDNSRSGTDGSTVYMSLNSTGKTDYKSIRVSDEDESNTVTEIAKEQNSKSDVSDEELKKKRKEETDASHLKSAYASTIDEESEVSETEDDEKTYIVYNQNQTIFLTLSSNYIREKDTITERTMAKWSLKILESCDRLKSNLIRINFDTVRKDRQERVYTVEDGYCQELEKKLRDILSARDLSEMNQTIYRCVNCTCQFSWENKNKRTKNEIHCPDCKSVFVAEILDIPKPVNFTETAIEVSLSPAEIATASLPDIIIQNSTLNEAQVPLKIEQNDESTAFEVKVAEENSSIGQTRLTTTTNTTTTTTTTNSTTTANKPQKCSANSLQESSSCSKISNSQSSFDSNQSVVGSSNTERDLDFKSNNGESDVDILSNPSQSSIEVLEHPYSRMTSEERRISQTPNLETISDGSYTTSYLEKHFGIRSSDELGIENDNNSNNNDNDDDDDDDELPTPVASSAAVQFPDNKQTTAIATTTTTTIVQTKNSKSIAPAGPLANFNLTESSSSGSVTDSICTAYESQQEKTITSTAGENEKRLLQQLLNEERSVSALGTASEDKLKIKEPVVGKKEDSAGASSMFGALFQSTNILMSSSKKLIDVEAMSNIKSGTPLPAHLVSATPTCKPYKFNYTDFNDVDHRIKLYFYQTKFEEEGEHFKWLARGQIFNKNTQTTVTGLVVMSTFKCYIMEAYAPENDEVTKWLRHVASVTVDRLESVQLLPWKIGLSFQVRDWGCFLLLLQDILRTDSLLLFFANNPLPSQCVLDYQPAPEILQRLNAICSDSKITMCSILNGCDVSYDAAKRTFPICALLATDINLYLTSTKFNWLSFGGNSRNRNENDADNEIELCITQLMSNLVGVDQLADENGQSTILSINFLDETENKCQLWKCRFETKENAETCLKAIGESWQTLFGVPLTNI